MTKFVKPEDPAWDESVERAGDVLKAANLLAAPRKKQIGMLENCFQNIRLKDIDRLLNEVLNK